MAAVAMQQARLTSMPYELKREQAMPGSQAPAKDQSGKPKPGSQSRCSSCLVATFETTADFLEGCFRCLCCLCLPRPRFASGMKKPVIYLFSPQERDVSVTLSLVSEWRFSVIYPVVPVKRLQSSEQIQWNVRTRLDGTLTELNQGLDVSYLFWEADNNQLPPSPPQSPTMEEQPAPEIFSPTSCDISESNSVVLPITDVTLYLDKTLRTLGLETRARTDFITFWLPCLMKHEFIAIRFLPQAVYGRAAPLEISPQPDVMTRVFMLFQGVSGTDWPIARARASEGVGRWNEIVGVDLERAMDSSLFRVLEWGGTEVEVRQ